MALKAYNGTVSIQEDTMDYVRFGTGERTLVMLPGLGEALQSIRGTALPVALAYRTLARHWTVYMFGRRNQLPAGYSTRDMARDTAQAMDALGLRQADVVGVSMGGMIAQHLAADAPEHVHRLALVVSCAAPTGQLNASIDHWEALARSGDHTALMDDNVRRIYSEGYYRRNRWLVPVMGRLTRPRSYERFFIQAQACRTHQAMERLALIQAPTLVVGGERDQVLGGDASRHMAERIPHASLRMYAQGGHGLYEEEKDFLSVVKAFLLEEGQG